MCLLSQATTGIRNFRNEGQCTGRNFKNNKKFLKSVVLVQFMRFSLTAVSQGPEEFRVNK